jgi:uncharacterized membrane protein
MKILLFIFLYSLLSTFVGVLVAKLYDNGRELDGGIYFATIFLSPIVLWAIIIHQLIVFLNKTLDKLKK